MKMYVSGVHGLTARKPLRLKRKNKKREKNDENKKRKETNKEFGARHKIFGVWPFSRDLALVDCLTHHASSTLL